MRPQQTTLTRTRRPAHRVEPFRSPSAQRPQAPLTVVDGGKCDRQMRVDEPAPSAERRTSGAEHAAADLLTERLDWLGRPDAIVTAMIDVDGLNDINAAKGRLVGDELVAMITEQIDSATRRDDLVVRAGGSRFVVVRSGIGRDISAARFVDRIRRTVTGRVAIAGHRIPVSVSVGFTIDRPSVFDSDRSARQRALDVLTQSHEALRDAKGRGPGHVVRFHVETAADDHETAMSTAITTALRRGELAADYEPIFCPGTGDTLGAKTVVRWHHPTDGVLEADQFMATAFRADAGLPLSDWLLTEACAATRRWLDERVVADDFAVHVDVTGIDIGEPTFVDRVGSILRDHRLRPHQLVLEVTEHNLALCDSNGVSSAIRDLRRKGVRISIDNFRLGSGAQTIATTVGADILRVDTGDTLTNDSDADTNVAQGLVVLAHGLGMKVVAEGIKGVDQLRRLRAAGCDLVHGVLLSTAAVPATAA